MTVFVDDAVLSAARTRAGGPLNAREVEQWRLIAAYAEQRPSDPTAARIAQLRSLFATRPENALAEAGRLLSDELLGGRPADEVRRRCVEWFDEDVATAAPLLDLFTGHHVDPPAQSPAASPDLVRKFGDWLRTQVGADTAIDHASVISGGFSRLMLDVRWTGGRGVVRIEQDGMFATEGHREVAVMRVLRGHGYPVPRVLWEESDPSVLGHPFFVMEFVEGAARVDDQGLDDVLRATAALHALTPAVDEVAALDGLAAGSTPAQVIDAQLAHWHSVYRAAVAQPIPLLERGFAWLRANLHPSGPSVVVHGDPGPGNALHNGKQIAAVIDWEFAHAGDAAEDWAYLALIRGRRLMSPAEWKARLADVLELHYDEATWHAWEVYNGVKGACVNLTALDVFRRSARPTPDHLAIGVAVHLRFLGRVVDLTGARA